MAASKQNRKMTKLTALLTGIVFFYLAFWLLTVDHHAKQYEEANVSFSDRKRQKAYLEFIRESKNDYSKIVEVQNRLHPLGPRRLPLKVKQEDQMHRRDFLEATRRNSTTGLNTRAQRRASRKEPGRKVVTEEETPEDQN